MINTITLQDLKTYIDHVFEINKPSTIVHKEQLLVYFIKIWKENNYFPKNINFKPDHISIPKKVLPIPSQSEFEQLVRCVSDKDFLHLLLAYRLSGMRLNECINITRKNIDTEKNIIILDNVGFKNKNNKFRYIPLLPELKKIILSRDPNDQYVFTSRHKKWNARSVQIRFAKLCFKALGHKNYSIHSLRRQWATWLRDQGVPIWKIKAWLGHSSILTTERYLGDTLAPEDYEETKQLRLNIS